MAYSFLIFGDMVTFLSFFLISILILKMSKKFLEKVSYPWYILVLGIFLIGTDSLFRLFSLLGYLAAEVTSLVTAIVKVGGSAIFLGGFVLVLFELASIFQLRILEGRKKDIEFLLSLVESKAENGLSKEVVDNLRKELIDIEKKMEKLK